MTLGIGTGDAAIRAAVPGDLDEIAAMHERCSPQSLRLRYLAGTRAPARYLLARLLDPALAVTFVAVQRGPDRGADRGAGPGDVIAAGNLARDGDALEAALLVEDAYQRRGIGTALFARLLGSAREQGHDTVVLHTSAENLAIQRMIRRLAAAGAGPAAYPVHSDGSVLTYLLPVAVAAVMPAG
ncbi:GNAT family N-acetyltransferase, partial [Hamadaea tsunoensis]|uniref:GNAT family N-acetyltransferase n=1 Tax=Hamadaea tsunoensis TaxID=53368 RepID=UPI00041E7A53